MAKLTTIGRLEVKLVRHELEGWLESFGEEMGLLAGVEGGARFTPDSMTFKLKIRLVDVETDCGKDLQQLDFERFAAGYGLEAEDFGRGFCYAGRSFTICGVAPRSYKYPILAKNPRGKVFKFAPKMVKAGLFTKK